MTALPEYALLEAPGFYAEAPDAPPREVLLGFGSAALTIMRFDETPLAHWPLASLALVARTSGPEGEALTLAPDAAAPERLTVSDPAMTAALRAVCPALGAPPPRPSRAPAQARRWRAVLWLLACVAAGAGAWEAGPDLRAALAAAAPPRTRAALGDAALRALAAGKTCAPGPRGRAALDAIGASLAGLGEGDAKPVLRLVDREGPGGLLAVVAPGGRIALFRPALERVDTPRALADGLALALARAQADPPLVAAARALRPEDALSDLWAAAAAILRGGAPTAPRLASGIAYRLEAPDAAGTTVEAAFGGRVVGVQTLVDAKVGCEGR